MPWEPNAAGILVPNGPVPLTPLRNAFQQIADSIASPGNGGYRDDWVPTVENATIGNGTVLARYRHHLGIVFWFFRWQLGSTSAITGTLAVNLPTVVPTNAYSHVGNGFVSRGPGQPELFACRMSGGTTWNGYMDVGAINATTPYAGGWTSGDYVSASGWYFNNS